MRRTALVAVVAVSELAAALVMVVGLGAPATAQLFDDRFPFIEERVRRRNYPAQRPDVFSPFGGAPERPAPPVDYSHAPAPKKQEGTPATSVVVMGDAMADWLAYGLEIAASESPDIGILRKHRTVSGLVKTEARDQFDWPQAARDILGQEKANFVVFMIGLGDRKPIREKRETSPPRGAAQAGQPNQPPTPGTPAAKPPDEATDDAEQTPDSAPVRVGREAVPIGTQVLEFRSEQWGEAYIKRIDETIAALKSRNVPVFWVGLPPIRGTRSSSDVGFLNELYRSRAEKAGITYIDVWDGFVDESGRFVSQGPDFEGQIRRLRSGDGVYFTRAGARKLAHYVERELQRAMVNRAVPVALPAPDEPVPDAPAPRGGMVARPLAGPVMRLTDPVDTDQLAGGGRPHQTVVDALASRGLVRGEPAPAPAGRADDFSWPRRGIAPVGTDPVVAATSLPMTPMQPEKPVVAAAAPQEGAAAAKPRPVAREGAARSRVAQRPDQRRYDPQPPPFFFPFFRRW